MSFRAFQKALVAPYSAEVNNRYSTTRGTTLTVDLEHLHKYFECSSHEDGKFSACTRCSLVLDGGG